MSASSKTNEQQKGKKTSRVSAAFLKWLNCDRTGKTSNSLHSCVIFFVLKQETDSTQHQWIKVHQASAGLLIINQFNNHVGLFSFDKLG